MLKCEGCESRKNSIDDIRLNPKYLNNGSFATYIRTGYCSTTIPLKGSRVKRFETSDSREKRDDEIVCAHMKI